MTTVTAVLGEESGIQYQGVQDKSGGMGQAVPSTLITGKFRRGVYGRTMTITTANIRGMLGYDPENPDYQAVEDALSTGIPSVQVIRLSADGDGDGGSGEEGSGSETPDEPWDIEYFYNNNKVREITGSIIPDYTYPGNSMATSLKFNNTVTDIGVAAFRVWSDAVTLELSSSIRNIGSGAFKDWFRLTTLVIPEGLINIAGEAFYDCRRVKNLVLPSTIETIGLQAFESYSSITESITIKAIVPPEIEYGAFNRSNNPPIYVPSESVEAYKTAPGWVVYANQILPIT